MVDADPIMRGAVVQETTVTKLRRYQVAYAIVSTNETVPMEVGTLVAAAAFRLDTGAEITTTEATTIVTVTEAALVNIPVVIIATGTV